jgi:hypothetical protein
MSAWFEVQVDIHFCPYENIRFQHVHERKTACFQHRLETPPEKTTLNAKWKSFFLVYVTTEAEIGQP